MCWKNRTKRFIPRIVFAANTICTNDDNCCEYNNVIYFLKWSQPSAADGMSLRTDRQQPILWCKHTCLHTAISKQQILLKGEHSAEFLSWNEITLNYIYPWDQSVHIIIYINSKRNTHLTLIENYCHLYNCCIGVHQQSAGSCSLNQSGHIVSWLAVLPIQALQSTISLFTVKTFYNNNN